MSDNIDDVKVTRFGDEGTMLMPPPPGVCQACAVDHHPAEPHNQQSLHYQYWFYFRTARETGEGRWPTWADAMEHCDDEIKAAWCEALEERGVDVDG